MTDDQRRTEEDLKLTFAEIGLTLYRLQNVEGLLLNCMGLVFCDEGGKPISDLTDPRTRKCTLGQMLSKLRQKFEVDPRFDELLEFFLEHRNTFVHGLTDGNAMQIDTFSGRANIRVFLTLLSNEIDTMSKMLLGVIMHWAEPEKYSDLTSVRVHHREGTLLGDAEQAFAPHTKKLFKIRQPGVAKKTT